jgi:FkbM family methyltransferase
MGDELNSKDALNIFAALQNIEQRLSLIEHRIANLQEMSVAQLQRQVFPLDDGFAAVRSAGGWFVLGAEEFRSLLHLSDGQGGHEPGTVAVLQSLVRPGDMVMDVGAHVGLLSVPLARAVGEGGHVMVVEPNPRSAEAARRTLSANGLLARCSLHVTALADREGEGDFFIGINSMMGSLIPDAGERQERRQVSLATIDSLVAEGAAVSLVKIDAEGAEHMIARGMRRVVADNPHIVVIAEYAPTHLQRAGVTPEQWFAAFAEIGLPDVCLIDEVDGTCAPFVLERSGDLFSANLLFSGGGNPRVETLSNPSTAP